MSILLLGSALFGIFATIGFGIAEYKKMTWGFGLVTSVSALLFPAFSVPELRSFAISLNVIFQPEVAYTVVNVWLLLLIIGGAAGIVSCLISGIRWIVRRFRAKRRAQIELLRPAAPRLEKRANVTHLSSYRSTRFNKYDV